MRRFARKIKYLLWKANGYFGRRITLGTPQKVTVLVTYYSPTRMKHIDPQVRNILKCQFVDKIIVSNHNPEIRIENMVKIRDERLVFINQKSQRGCGYRWIIANEFNPEYLIVVDDDILLFPSQLRIIFKNLINEPEIPHGISGMLHHANGDFEYYEKMDMQVDYLCEIYAVTRQNLHRYLELESFVTKDDSLSKMIESSADFMLISQTGSQNPKIHNVGRLFRCPTFNEPGVAVHKAPGFDANMVEVSRALNNLIGLDRSVSSRKGTLHA
jgi:hypothetical protein